jgi:hypothetical protein
MRTERKVDLSCFRSKLNLSRISKLRYIHLYLIIILSRIEHVISIMQFRISVSRIISPPLSWITQYHWYLHIRSTRESFN